MASGEERGSGPGSGGREKRSRRRGGRAGVTSAGAGPRALPRKLKSLRCAQATGSRCSAQPASGAPAQVSWGRREQVSGPGLAALPRTGRTVPAKGAERAARGPWVASPRGSGRRGPGGGAPAGASCRGRRIPSRAAGPAEAAPSAGRSAGSGSRPAARASSPARTCSADSYVRKSEFSSGCLAGEGKPVSWNGLAGLSCTAGGRSEAGRSPVRSCLACGGRAPWDAARRGAPGHSPPLKRRRVGERIYLA